MNSLEYIEVAVEITPFSEEASEILLSEVSSLPYEAFVTEAPFLKCYIQKDAYRASELKVVLSGLDGMGIRTRFSANLVQGCNWNRAWEERFEPITVDGCVTIKALLL